MDFFSNADIFMRFVLALGLVLGLIALTAWVAKLFGFNPMLKFGKTSSTRLNISDSFQIDNTHKLLIIKRDQVEHLICIGGQNEFVIEANIRHDRTITPPKFIKKINEDFDQEEDL